MKKIRIVSLIIAGLTVVLLAACGGTADTGPGQVELRFTGHDEFRFDPNTASVPAGAEVTVTFENVGVLEHNWLLISDRIRPEDATPADAITGATSGEIEGGQTATFTFTAPPAGNYTFVCTVPGHAIGGMVGAFTITP